LVQAELKKAKESVEDAHAKIAGLQAELAM
jgi:hypothetical protein